MISDEEIWKIADSFRGYGGEIDIEQFAREIERISRQQQRESDAALCLQRKVLNGNAFEFHLSVNDALADAIRNNKEN